jgi:hypothetical protein
MAKQCRAPFFCKLAGGRLISWRIFQFHLVLTNKKQHPFGPWLNNIGMLLENWSNTIDVLRVNLSNNEKLQNTCYTVLIIYKSYATYFPSGARGKRWLHHCWSITVGIYLVFNTDLQKSAISHCSAPFHLH